MTQSNQLTLILHVEGLCHKIFDVCLNMPKKVRFSVAQRLENYCLDLLTSLYKARYHQAQALKITLNHADSTLAQLRALCRFAHARQLISHRAFEQLASGLNETGKMLGGWLKACH